MALSNIFKEPRRELTESAVGLVLFVVPASIFAWTTYKFAIILATNGAAPHDSAAIVIAFIYEVVGSLIIWGFLFMTHHMGQSFCNWLAEKGIELRPRRRYR